MSIAELKEYTRIARYAGYSEEKKRRETWNEQIDREVNMHRVKIGDKIKEFQEDFDIMEDMMRKKFILGSQRALQFAGRAILEKNCRLFNCSASYCDRTRFFQEAMWVLLCGAGVGFSVQKHHVRKLPQIVKPNARRKRTFVAEDSIEGWADSIGALLSSYFSKNQPIPEFADSLVDIDLSNIRPRGSTIKSTGGKAPGPDPLSNAIDKIRELMDRCVSSGQTRLKPIDCYDIVMHASDAVLSGGIRRSATICLFSPEDEEMLTAKTGKWRIDNPQRGRSNNSILLIRENTTREYFESIVKHVKEYGEPGFVWADDTEMLVNPCCEVSLYGYDEKGQSGFGFCNLSEQNMKKAKDVDTFLTMCKAAATVGTIQATYNKFDYLGKVSEDIMQREALLGVSMTGMMDNPHIAFNPDIQRKGAEVVKETNQRIAKILEINAAARTTVVKPAGTASCILGTSSGIHPHHAKRYFRRVQANNMEEPLKFFRKYNPIAVEPSVWSENNTDSIITFCCEVPPSSRTKVNTDAITMLELVKLTQQNWVSTGKVKSRCAQPWLTHNVSNTINVKEDEWDIVTDFVYKNRKFFTGVTLLAVSGDKDYPQAPFTTVYNEIEIANIYGKGSPMASGLIVDGIRAWDGDLWQACDFVLGIGEDLSIPKGISDREEKAWKRKVNYEDKIEWKRRALQFANRYFDGNIREMTYCLKDVNNWKLWCDLQREFKPVPWEEFTEGAENIKISETVACSGGTCDMQI